MATNETLAKMWILLCDAFPSAKPNERTALIYKRVLSDLDDRLLEAATLQCIGSCRFFPTVAELRQQAHELASLTDHTPIPGDAWAEVMTQIRRCGIYREPQFSHELIVRAVLAVGGWTYLCSSENIVADRARFLECYNDYLKLTIQEQRLLPPVRKLLTWFDENPPKPCKDIPLKTATAYLPMVKRDQK